MTAKLPILNPGKYDPWFMRIEQYFLMTDYSLWEVIKNGNKVLKRIVRTSEETYEPTSAEEKLDKRNEMKARGTLLMAFPNKDQMKNKAELETIILDDLYNNLKIYEPELLGSSHTNQNLQNMAFVSSNSPSSTNEADTTASGVSIAHTQEEPKSVRKNNFSPPIIEDWHLDDESEEEISPTIEVKNVKPSVEKIKFVKPARETVKTEESPKQHKHHPRGNQRNWNNLMSQRLGSNFKMINKACYVYGSFEYLQYVCDKRDVRPMRNNSNRVDKKNFANKLTHSHPKRGFVPQAVLTRSGKINTAGASVTTAARPVNTTGSKSTMNHPRLISNAFKRGHSQVIRPFNKYSAYNKMIFNKETKTAQAKEIVDLKKRVKKLESKRRLRSSRSIQLGYTVGSFYLEKNKTSDYPYYTDDAKIDTYYDLPPSLPCFKPIQPYTKRKNESYKAKLNEKINYMSDGESVMSEHGMIINTDAPDAPNLEPHDEGMRSDDDVDEWFVTEMEEHAKRLTISPNRDLTLKA
nr:ribonuclease H-like domain-containing protein [Tanacetum cinerariifolium]